MLRRLALEEFVIVEKAALEFGPGLNALTGETGAGKSILIDAIGLLRGGRAGADWIRRGASRLAVEGELDLSGSPEGIEAAARLEVPLEEGALLLVRREVGSDGRSRCFAGGRQVLVSQLRELTAGSLWIVGQGEQRALADPVEQEWILDRFGDCGELRARWRERREAFLEAGVRLAELRRRREEFARESDWLRAQTEEIRAAEVAPGERERLRERLQRLRGRETELALVDELEARLFREEGSVLDHLETLQHRLAHLDDPRWEELRAAVAALRDQARELRARLPGLDPDLDADPAAVEERLRALERICRRHGSTDAGVSAEAEARVLARLEEMESALADGEELPGAIARAEAGLEAARRAAGEAGADLSAARERAAERLAERVAAELERLGMPGARLRFLLDREPDPEGVPLGGADDPAGRLRAYEGGLERPRLLFQSHPTEAEGELGRIASGGELSRILLAVHAALGEASPPGCWILDEVDAGIGGETAARVAGQLASMARRAQVLLVTHLPVIAARAQRHVRVVKAERDGRPVASVDAVDGEARVGELARMLAGDPASAVARRHAGELLAAAREAELAPSRESDDGLGGGEGPASPGSAGPPPSGAGRPADPPARRGARRM